MKNRLFMAAITMIIALALSFPFIGCDETGDDPTNEAKLLEVSLAGNVTKEIPAVIPQDQFEDDEFSPSDLEEEQTGALKVSSQAEFQDAEIKLKMSKGAKAVYGEAKSSNLPEEWLELAETTQFSNTSSLYIRVTSGDNKTTNYYRFKLSVKSGTITISGITVAGKQASYIASDSLASAQLGKIELASDQLANQKIVVTKNATTEVKFAVTSSSSDVPVFTTQDTYNLADTKIIFVEAIAENGNTKAYYKIEVHSGRITTIKSLKVADLAIPMGQPSDNWSSVVAGTLIFNGDPVTGAVSADVTEDGAKAEYALMTSDGALPTTFASSLNVTSFTNGNVIAVKVTGGNGKAVSYYKVKVDTSKKGKALDVTKGWKLDGPWFRVEGSNPFTFQPEQNRCQIYRFPAGTFASGESITDYTSIEITWTVTGGTGTFGLCYDWNKADGGNGGDIGWDNHGVGESYTTSRTGLTIPVSRVTNAAERAEITGWSFQRQSWRQEGDGWTLEITSMYLIK